MQCCATYLGSVGFHKSDPLSCEDVDFRNKKYLISHQGVKKTEHFYYFENCSFSLHFELIAPCQLPKNILILVTGCPVDFPSEWPKTGAPRWGLGGPHGAAPYQSLSSGHAISVQTTELSEFLLSITSHGPVANQWG